MILAYNNATFKQTEDKENEMILLIYSTNEIEAGFIANNVVREYEEFILFNNIQDITKYIADIVGEFEIIINISNSDFLFDTLNLIQKLVEDGVVPIVFVPAKFKALAQVLLKIGLVVVTIDPETEQLIEIKEETYIHLPLLTIIEISIVVLAAEGKSNEEIGEIRRVSLQTIKNQITIINQKLDSNGEFRTEAVVKARKLGYFW